MVERLIVTVHGVRSDGRLLRDLAETCAERLVSAVVDPISIGAQRLRHFRVAELRETFFRDAAAQYRERVESFERRNGVEPRVSVIAHSFGTLAFFEALREPRMPPVEHLCLLGSIIPPGVRWARLRDAGVLLNRALNIVRPFDLIVGRANLVSGGLSGVRGFNATDGFAPIDHFKAGGHNDYGKDSDDIVEFLRGRFGKKQATPAAEFRRSLSLSKKVAFHLIRPLGL